MRVPNRVKGLLSVSCLVFGFLTFTDVPLIGLSLLSLATIIALWRDPDTAEKEKHEP